MSDGSAAYYSDRAELMRKRAQEAESENIKAAYLGIAKDWECMAEAIKSALDLTLDPSMPRRQGS